MIKITKLPDPHEAVVIIASRDELKYLLGAAHDYWSAYAKEGYGGTDRACNVALNAIRDAALGAGLPEWAMFRL